MQWKRLTMIMPVMVICKKSYGTTWWMAPVLTRRDHNQLFVPECPSPLLTQSL
jgi:hypothetical protein